MALHLDDLLNVPGISGAWITPGGAAPTDEIHAIVVDGMGDPLPDTSYLQVGVRVADEAPDSRCVAFLVRERPESPPSRPTLVLPGGVAMMEAITELKEALDGPGGLARRTRSRAALRELTRVEATADDVAVCAAEELEAPIAILDEHLDILGVAGPSLDQREALMAAVDAARGRGPASPMGVFERATLDGAVQHAVVRGREPVGMVVAWVGADLTGPQRAVLDEIDAAVLGMRSRDAVRLDTEARLKGDFIEELSSGESLPADSVIRRARHLGCDLSSGAVALVGALHDPHDEGRLITDARLVRRFLQRARSVVGLKRPGTLVHWREDNLLVLLPPSSDITADDATAIEADARTIAERLLEATNETVPGVALTLALSRFTADPARLGTTIEEARLAYSIGERLGRTGQLMSFEQTGSYRLLFRVLAERPEEMVAFFAETILPIIDYDTANQTDLTATLAAYLGNDGNLAATASQLFTHRHTVRYRLDRIADLTDLNVSMSDDREMLSLGLKTMRLLGRSIPAPADAADDTPAVASA